MSMTVIFAGAGAGAARPSRVAIPDASRSARSCSARTSSAVLYSRRSRLSSLRRFHISFCFASFSRLALAFSAATFSAALFVFRASPPAPVRAASSSSSSSEPSLLLSRPASLKPLKPMPMFLGLIWVSIGAAIPLPSLPRPMPFLYPIFSSSFMPMPLVCFSNSPSFGSGFAFSHGRLPLSPRRLPRSRCRSMSSSFFLSRASSASLRRCAAFCMTLCPNVLGRRSSSSLSFSSTSMGLSAPAAGPSSSPSPPPLAAAKPRPPPPKPIPSEPKPSPEEPSPPRVVLASSSSFSTVEVIVLPLEKPPKPSPAPPWDANDPSPAPLPMPPLAPNPAVGGASSSSSANMSSGSLPAPRPAPPPPVPPALLKFTGAV
mmetsp:Transcript_9413/g.38483  ORF Transcript_9413/g.38483 Transcript_9413/m.38483 type:complete len:374 (-) Transcript_9413:229-1350(-)